MHDSLCCTCRDELLTNCKEATAISAVPWCFTEYNNKRRACTEEPGAVRPLTWYLKDNQVCRHSDCQHPPWVLAGNLVLLLALLLPREMG